MAAATTLPWSCPFSPWDEWLRSALISNHNSAAQIVRRAEFILNVRTVRDSDLSMALQNSNQRACRTCLRGLYVFPLILLRILCDFGAQRC